MVHQTTYPIATMCRLLAVCPSRYCAWRRRGPSPRAQEDVRLSSQQSQIIHDASLGTYGVPRVHMERTEAGAQVGRKQVAQLMRGTGVRRGQSAQGDVRHRPSAK
jgi:putative transposase